MVRAPLISSPLMNSDPDWPAKKLVPKKTVRLTFNLKLNFGERTAAGSKETQQKSLVRVKQKVSTKQKNFSKRIDSAEQWPIFGQFELTRSADLNNVQ